MVPSHQKLTTRAQSCLTVAFQTICMRRQVTSDQNEQATERGCHCQPIINPPSALTVPFQPQPHPSTKSGLVTASIHTYLKHCLKTSAPRMYFSPVPKSSVSKLEIIEFCIVIGELLQYHMWQLWHAMPCCVSKIYSEQLRCSITWREREKVWTQSKCRIAHCTINTSKDTEQKYKKYRIKIQKKCAQIKYRIAHCSSLNTSE